MEKFEGFIVNGKPFFVLGAQAHNSSSYNESEFEKALIAAEKLYCNTIEAPIYWEKVEPEEGKFDFSLVDMMIRKCREHSLKLILLWFASWKNGEMHYCPEFVKKDTVRFPRVIGADGTRLLSLSTHYESNWKADANAFARLMNHIKEVDAQEQTVIAVQVENEPGYIRTDRDYSEAAQKDLAAPVPEELFKYLEQRRTGEVYEEWAKHGFRKGNWIECFGLKGIEFCEAWSLAKYIDYVAGEGKKYYDIPMYVNVWLSITPWGIPGLNYPCGGAIPKVLDIWKCATKHIDFIAPDNYQQNYRLYRDYCDAYTREDNLLFIPESSRSGENALHMFYAIGSCRAIGYSVFGVESMFDKDGNVKTESAGIMESYKAIRSAINLILKHRKTGKMYAVVQDKYVESDIYEFERYIGCTPYQFDKYSGRKDYYSANYPTAPLELPYRGLIFEDSPTEFYLAGNFHLRLAYKSSPEWNGTRQMFDMVDYVSVEEGYFDPDGQFVTTKVRNGDEVAFGGFWVTPHCGVVRVKLLDINA